MTQAVAPPVAPRLPFVGNALTFLKDPLRFLCETRDRYGDVVDVALGPMQVTLVSDPAIVEDILVGRSRLFQKDRFLRTSLRPVLGDGLLSSEGDFWRRQRRLAQPAFHRDRIRAYGDIMVRHATRLTQRWRDGEERDVHADMMRLTLEIVAEALFGADVGGQAGEVAEALEDILDVVSDTLGLFFPILNQLPTPKRRRFERAVATLDRIIYGMIEAGRAKGGDGDDLLSMLLAARDEDGSRMSDKQLRDECITLFLAGHETTAINLSWTFLLLSCHRDVRAALEAEVDRVVGDRAPTTADVSQLPLASRVIAESMRLYPPAWSMGREAREDLELAGYRVRAGDQIWFCPWAIHRDRRWFDAPDEFRPERWDGDLAKTLPRFAYFPFGGGPRLCIGQAFAQMEAVLVLATIVRAFRVDVDGSRPIVPDPSVTLRPRDGLRAVLHRRRA